MLIPKYYLINLVLSTLFIGFSFTIYAKEYIDSIQSEPIKTNKYSLDSLSNQASSKNKKLPYKIIPRVATMHSLMIPGWGQLYNRQYWKLPLVAGAFVSLGLIANYNHTRYKKYREYYYIVSPHPDDPSYPRHSLRRFRHTFVAIVSHGFPQTVFVPHG